jgi:hypothetical protein
MSSTTVQYWHASQNIVQFGANFAQILLLGGFYFTWRQLKIAVGDIQLRSEREAAMLSIKEADQFAAVLIPAYHVIESKFGGLPGIPNKLDHFFPSEINGPNQQKYRDKLDQMKADVELHKETHTLANKMESMAMAFMKGVADEKMVFGCMGDAYCRMIEGIYFFYCECRKNSKSNFYLFDNTINLYRTWSSRIEKGDLEKARNIIDKRISIVSTASLPIKPVGTV